MEEVVEKTKSFAQTMNLRKLIGVRVLTERGFSIGRVLQIRIIPEMKTIEGILVRRGLFKEPLFLGNTYFDKLSHEAVILNIEPSILLKGKKVVTYDGEVIGNVKKVVRLGNTNIIKVLVARSFLRGSFNVSAADIKSLGKSIILKSSYNAPKKSFWRRT